MKRLFSVVTALVLLFALCACGTTADIVSSATETTGAAVSNGTATVRGIVKVKDCLPMICSLHITNTDTGVSYNDVTDMTGAFVLKLEAGNYTIEFGRGPEYSKETLSISLKKNTMKKLGTIELVQITDLYEKGWVAGDLHQHTYYSDGSVSVSSQLIGNMARGLYFCFLTDHNVSEGLTEWTTGNDMVAYRDSDSTRWFRAFDGLEITTQYGHYQSLGKVVQYNESFVNISKELQAKEGSSEYNTEIKGRITEIATALHNAGTIAQINHPYSSRDMGFHFWELADLYDTIEIWNGVFVPGDGRYEDTAHPEQNYQSKIKWFELLNEVKNGGKFYAATSGTDNHDGVNIYTSNANLDLTTIDNITEYNEVYNRSGVTNGVPTIFVYCPGEKTTENVLKAVKNGNSFLSNGITVLANVNGAIYGQTTKASKAKSIDVDVHCEDGLDFIKVVKNGEVVKQINFNASETLYKNSIELGTVKSGDWIVLEVAGSGANYAITNPIFFN